MAIPKIIHQIWLGPKRRPDFWMDRFREYAKAHPDWSYVLWDETSLAGQKLHNQRWFELESTYHGKADILRYELLYSFGGIYIDADSLLLPGKDLDQLLLEAGDKELFAARGLAEGGLITQGVVGASPQHPVLEAMILDLQKNYLRRMMNPPWISTGPKAFNAVVEKQIDQVHLFPTEYFFPGGWHFDAQEWKSDLSKRSVDDWARRYPNSYFVQFGYSTNNLESFVAAQSEGEKTS